MKPSENAPERRYWSRMGSRPSAQDNAICATCEKTFHVKPSVLAKGKGKYCSKECVQYTSGPEHPLHGRVLSEGTERVCVGCGATFRHRRARVRYCSAACHHRTNPRPFTPGHRQVMANGYVRLTLESGERVVEHRHVWREANGEIPEGAHIHHRNGDKTDNRLENLQLVRSQQEHCDAHGGAFRTYETRMADCHPDRRHRSLGMCQSCYSKYRYRLKRAQAMV